MLEMKELSTFLLVGAVLFPAVTLATPPRAATGRSRPE